MKDLLWVLEWIFDEDNRLSHSFAYLSFLVADGFIGAGFYHPPSMPWTIPVGIGFIAVALCLWVIGLWNEARENAERLQK